MASLLSPWTSTSLNHCCRTNEACSSTQTMLSFYSFRFRQRCNVKLCFQLSRAFSGSGVLNPAAPERSRNMGNCLKSDMSYINDLEEQLHELFNEVSTMIKTGKRNDAVDLLQANYEAVKEQIDAGFTGIEEAAVLDVIALGHMALGDLNKVGSMLDLLSKIVEGLKNDEPLLDSILMHMGSVYEKMEEFEISFSSYNRALANMEREYGVSLLLISESIACCSRVFFGLACRRKFTIKNNFSNLAGDASSYLIIPLLGMAKALGCLGSATKSIETYHRAISILESSNGEENEELVVPLFALGNLLLKERRAADAETAFGRIINIYMKLYGENDVKVGLALCSLADVKCSKGNIDEAIVLYRKALQILKDSECAADDKVMEKMRVDLAELLHLVGRDGEGRALLEECLLITEKFNGKEHPSSVTHLVNLATSYSRSKNYAEAEKLLRISLRIMLKTLPPDDQSISFPMLHLAVALYNLNQTDEAEKYALEVLRIREKAFGKDSLPVGEALDCLVSIQSRLGKDDDELLDHLNRVLKIQEKAFGGDSEEVMETLKKIVHYMTRIGLKHEKLPLQRRLSRLRDKHKQAVKF